MIDCGQCGRKLAAAFPGARVTCLCGWTMEIFAPAAPVPAGPYRGASLAHEGTATSPCPFCGNLVPALVRICPHCDVRLENVRCKRCYSLQQPGSFACHRCGTALELEPLLDATDAPCPRCRHALEVAPGDDWHECPRCGGMFVPKEKLATLLTGAEVSGAVPDAAVAIARASRPPDEIRYLPCPLCHGSMNRINFGRVSGVIVDVCRVHGTWFDVGELTRVVAFMGAGGGARTRAREAEERYANRALGISDPLIDDWNDLLKSMLFW